MILSISIEISGKEKKSQWVKSKYFGFSKEDVVERFCKMKFMRHGVSYINKGPCSVFKILNIRNY